MLLRNDVLHYADPSPRAIRILWIGAQQKIAYTFELRSKGAQPRPVALAALVADVLAQRAQLLLADPYAAPPQPAQPPAKHLAVQAKALATVSALTAGLPAIFERRQRAQLVASYAALHGISQPTIHRYLRRYWERGQTPDALLPDYANSGGRGKTRAASAGVKRGRPPKSGKHPGLNSDTEMRATFRAAVARYAATHDQFSRRAAYRQMIEDFFGDREAGSIPSFGQFNYWTEKDLAGAVVTDVL